MEAGSPRKDAGLSDVTPWGVFGDTIGITSVETEAVYLQVSPEHGLGCTPLTPHHRIPERHRARLLVAVVVVAQVVTLTAALLGDTSPVSMAVSFCTTTNCAKFNPMPYVMAAAWRRKEVVREKRNLLTDARIGITVARPSEPPRRCDSSYGA